MIAVFLDIASGFIAAKMNGNFSSREAVNGIMRQGMRLAFFLASQYVATLVIDQSATLNLALTTFQVAMIAGYVYSLRENYQKFAGIEA